MFSITIGNSKDASYSLQYIWGVALGLGIFFTIGMCCCGMCAAALGGSSFTLVIYSCNKCGAMIIAIVTSNYLASIKTMA